LHLNVSAQLAALSDQAATLSVQQGQYFVGVEHLFFALLEDTDAWPAKFREQYLDALYAVQRELFKHAWRGEPPTQTGEVFHTPRAIAVTNAATKIAARFRHPHAQGAHVLLAILSQEQSSPSRAMERLGLDRKACVEELRKRMYRGHATALDAAPPVPAAAAPVAAGTDAAPSADSMGTFLPFDSDPPADAKKREQLPKLTRDLNQAAQNGKLQPVIGRKNEIVEVMQILTRKTKNNAMIVGEAGV